MSAIAGVLNYYGEPVSIEAARNMMQGLQKYPADDVRTWYDGSVFLGCHAQWITPESIHERLPYYDEQSKLAITADAIIDNRGELFNRLQVAKSRREQMADSELILLAYLKWGKEAPQYLIGDYAFVIWDEKRQHLFGARDLLGNRTLYYRHDARQFVFCTVINPLFTLPGVNKGLNESWIAEFLAIPYILDSIDVRSTLYSSIDQIPPAHTFQVANGKLTLEQYGTFTVPDKKIKFRSNAEYEEAFRQVFLEAITSKSRTFRQVGASLSGGLDSGAVVSFAVNPLHKAGKTLHAYSYVPPSDFVDWTSKSMLADESSYIRATVEHVGNLTHSYMGFSEQNSFSEIDDLIDLMEAPYKFFENSFWLKGMLEQAQRDDVGVLLNGARGNYTISWGPAIDYYARLLRNLRWVRFYREIKLYGKIGNIGRSRLLPFIGKQAFPFLTRMPFSKREPNKPLLIHPDLAARTGVIEKLTNHDVGLTESTMDEFAAREYQFNHLAISNHQGTSTTKLSLRYSVCERDPTSDPRVIRFCLSVPVEQFVQNGRDRSLIRRSTAGYLPDKVRLNQRVRGVQGADWIHRMLPIWRLVTEEVKHLCRDSAVSQLLNVKQIQASLAKIGDSPKPELAYDPDVRLIMQSLIVYRFLQKIS
ncbi:asparagine synthase-related protein [Paenibacillus sedimenti]|uniref:asparagine synthase (glutamine-hydrolyzing) n=1 Tax=Paenibacillus sedimenti TaxID=2770274 RepID=A0A926KPF7_9BACL|nr:asparagine synthase-related protein [Paenibacillus sedimenti]MBD0379730.1 asparagine synthetase B [Paenibacillus sedimenti]